MSKDKNTEKIRKILEQRRHAKFRERVLREKEIAFEKFKKEIFENSKPTISKEEREKRRKELIAFIDRYTFLTQAENVVQSYPEIAKASYLKGENFFKRLLNFIIIFRNLINSFFKLRSILILFSAFFFFSLEYWVHYYTFFSFKDINLTFKDIIEKIPPFF